MHEIQPKLKGVGVMELVGEQPVYVLKSLKALFSRIGSDIVERFELSGYARAAQHLRSMGYYEEAEHCYKMMNVIRSKK